MEDPKSTDAEIEAADEEVRAQEERTATVENASSVADPFGVGEQTEDAKAEPAQGISGPSADLWYARRSRKSNDWGVVRNNPQGFDWVIMPQPPRSHLHLTAGDCTLIARTHNAALQQSFLFIEPQLSHRTYEPQLNLAWGAETATLTMEKAYQIAHQILDGIHAAMSDAVTFRFLIEKIFEGAKDPETLDRAARLLAEFRDYRRNFVPDSMKQDDMFVEEPAKAEDISQ